MILRSLIVTVFYLTFIGRVSGESFSSVYFVRGESGDPVNYFSFPVGTYPNAQLNQVAVATLPQTYANLATPCVLPCIIPSQTLENANLLAYQAPNLPIVAAAKDENSNYQYSYIVYDSITGDEKAQHEISNGGTVRGQYSVVQPDGLTRQVTYTADDLEGFKAIVNYLRGDRENPSTKKKEPLVQDCLYSLPDELSDGTSFRNQGNQTGTKKQDNDQNSDREKEKPGPVEKSGLNEMPKSNDVKKSKPVEISKPANKTEPDQKPNLGKKSEAGNKTEPVGETQPANKSMPIEKTKPGEKSETKEKTKPSLDSENVKQSGKKNDTQGKETPRSGKSITTDDLIETAYVQELKIPQKTDNANESLKEKSESETANTALLEPKNIDSYGNVIRCINESMKNSNSPLIYVLMPSTPC